MPEAQIWGEIVGDGLLNSRPIKQYTKTGILIKTWAAAKEAARELGLSQGNIASCCKGNYKSTGGFIFKYANT